MNSFETGKISIYLFVILLLTTCHPVKDPDGEAVRSLFKDIQGTWKLVNKPLYESWSPEGKDFMGKVILVKNNDTIIRETIQLILSDTACIYRVRVPDQNEGKPVDFLLRDVEGKMVVFENPFHDFPTSIQYELKSKDTLVARTFGIIKGKEKKIEFRYLRNQISF